MHSSLGLLKQAFLLSSDEVLIADYDGNISYKNNTAKECYPEITNLSEIFHLFNFEICILKSEDIMTYTPLSAALKSKEEFFANISKQIKSNYYLEYSISSIPIDEYNKCIILKNIANINLLDKYETLEKKSADLSEQVINAGELKSKLENLLLRTNLVNFVSDKILELVDAKQITDIVTEELKKTLDTTKVEFVENNALHQFKETKISSEIDENTLHTKLFVPVYREDKVYGTIILHRSNIQNTWQTNEIDLIKNISSLLATAFSKAELYKELASQKTELEIALEKLKNAQLQIVQTEKMAALGQLVAGVAHEINTPLAAISGNFNLLEKISETSSAKNELNETFEEILPVNKEAIRRIDTMIKSLRKFTRLDEAKKKKIDIHEGIKSSLNLLAHEIKNRITITTDFAKLPQICCYPDYINQVFMNILLNATQSIKNKGDIYIKSEIDGDFIKIIIKDTGKGIPKENLEKIFDFGFTTKKIGEGTGLGLALAKKIIDEHKGKIFVESEISKGTTFFIYLPLQ